MREPTDTPAVAALRARYAGAARRPDPAAGKLNDASELRITLRHIRRLHRDVKVAMHDLANAPVKGRA